jgi:hypothetical protein
MRRSSDRTKSRNRERHGEGGQYRQWWLRRPGLEHARHAAKHDGQQPRCHNQYDEHHKRRIRAFAGLPPCDARRADHSSLFLCICTYFVKNLDAVSTTLHF